ncbi:competence protein CoiA [Sedimentimonas flavescens]|uniref:competence protein CoiA n=1 Tax=Sedimentimonas flavescens TaxID=2851012 RepID=UPI0021A69BF0|nr:competence protein CoiA family protein [Sedimentimonas flavescens]MCT2541086.1 competence protein CoiA family protein [Sedimentimonas flavescens]
MLTADVNGSRCRPLPGAVGSCPFCNSEMIPRCGEVRVHHWAHKSKADCDPWWEPETDWHRNWKNEFPLRWQEYLFTDHATGERHIADVHTLAGLTVEFQHSHLEPNERRARETFYKNMLWIVDGSRLEGNRKKITEWRNKLAEIIQNQHRTNLFLTDNADDLFPANWTNSPAPVCFDYMGPKADSSSDPQPLFLLYPETVHRKRLVEPLTRDGLLRSILSERLNMNSVRGIMQNVASLRLGGRRR